MYLQDIIGAPICTHSLPISAVNADRPVQDEVIPHRGRLGNTGELSLVCVCVCIYVPDAALSCGFAGQQ